MNLYGNKNLQYQGATASDSYFRTTILTNNNGSTKYGNSHDARDFCFYGTIGAWFYQDPGGHISYTQGSGWRYQNVNETLTPRTYQTVNPGFKNKGDILLSIPMALAISVTLAPAFSQISQISLINPILIFKNVLDEYLINSAISMFVKKIGKPLSVKGLKTKDICSLAFSSSTPKNNSIRINHK